MLCCLSEEDIEERKRNVILENLPIHRAFIRGETITAKMLEENKSTLNKKDFDGRTALEIIFQKKNSSPISAELLCELILGSISFDNSTGKVVDTDGWAKAVQCNDDITLEAVEKVLTVHGDKVSILVYSVDKIGRIIMDIATPRMKKILSTKVLLYKRYELNDGPPVYRSAKNIVAFAKDHGMEGLPVVAIKFLRDRKAFLNEVESREASGFDRRYVLPIFTHYDGNVHTETERSFRKDAIMKGFNDYPHCIVMEAADTSLQLILDGQSPRKSLIHLVKDCDDDDDDDDAIEDESGVKHTLSNVIKCLEHIHSKGFMHGDVRPLNILLVGRELRLTNLDMSANYRQKDLANQMFSDRFKSNKEKGTDSLAVLGNTPPEMLWIDVIGVCRLRFSSDTASSSSCPKASPAIDMWGLGTLMYLLVTGHTLFHCTTEGKIVEQEEIHSLYDWKPEYKARKLRAVSNNIQRDLLSRLLSKDAALRPTASAVLEHPYFTGGAFKPPEHHVMNTHVYLCYRYLVDDNIVGQVNEALEQRGLDVWYDAKSIPPGTNRMVSYISGILSTSVFVVFLTRQTLRTTFMSALDVESATEDSDSDLLLLLYSLASELKAHGAMGVIIPVLIGDLKEDKTFGNYITDNCHPNAANVVVKSIHDKVAEILDGKGWGIPLLGRQTLKEITDSMVSSQEALLVQGSFASAVDSVAAAIYKAVMEVS